MGREQTIDILRAHAQLRGKPKALHWPDHFEAPWSNISALQIFDEFRQSDTIEIPGPEDREGSFPNDDCKYWMAGLSDYVVMKGNVPSLANRDIMVLDFGGATGRVSRHFITERAGTRVTIAEANVNYVAWINANGGFRFNAVAVGPYPEIPVADNTFDFAFGISVFTHINSGELGWLAELSRIVKQGGIIYLTILSDHSWRVMDADTLFQTIKGDKNPSLATAIGRNFPCARCSVRLEYEGDVNNWNTFHSERYIRRKWSRIASVEKIVHQAHGYQSAVILRNDKRASRRQWIFRSLARATRKAF